MMEKCLLCLFLSLSFRLTECNTCQPALIVLALVRIVGFDVSERKRQKKILFNAKTQESPEDMAMRNEDVMGSI